MELIHALAEKYADQITVQEDVLLQSIIEQTLKEHPQAHMLSGKIQGAFLSFISSIIQPAKILEIGTFTGYSALCLAKGLTTNG